MSDHIPHNPAHARFRTGARPTPRHKLASAPRFRPGPVVKARPIVVPSFLEMWLNDQYGDCVSAEEAAAIAFYSVMCGLAETKITDATLMAFCQANNLLNGADLTQVMDLMISQGLPQGGATYKDGPYAAVDYSTESVLQAALEIGPVKIGIDSSALPSGAGSANGWYASGGSPGQFSNEDHCVSIWNYGSSADLFAALNTPVPAGFPATGYHLYTWATVGVVDHAWVMSTVGEAWIRNPTTLGVNPTPGPGPSPGPTPTPTPAGNALVLASALAAGTYGIGGTDPLPPAVVAALQQAQAAIASALGQQSHDGFSTYTIRVNLKNLFDDILATAADVAAKNWMKVITVDVPAILADLKA